MEFQTSGGVLNEQRLRWIKRALCICRKKTPPRPRCTTPPPGLLMIASFRLTETRPPPPTSCREPNPVWCTGKTVSVPSPLPSTPPSPSLTKRNMKCSKKEITTKWFVKKFYASCFSAFFFFLNTFWKICKCKSIQPDISSLIDIIHLFFFDWWTIQFLIHCPPKSPKESKRKINEEHPIWV